MSDTYATLVQRLAGQAERGRILAADVQVAIEMGDYSNLPYHLDRYAKAMLRLADES